METERLELLPWNREDIPSFRPIATDPRVMRYINGGRPWNDDEMNEFVNRQIGNQERLGFSLWKAIDKASGELAGFCGIQPFVFEGVEQIEIGWWLARHYWGRGLATEAARCVLDFAFHSRTGPAGSPEQEELADSPGSVVRATPSAQARLSRIIAIAQPDNRASRRVMEKIGMRYERDATHKGFAVVVYVIIAPR